MLLQYSISLWLGKALLYNKGSFDTFILMNNIKKYPYCVKLDIISYTSDKHNFANLDNKLSFGKDKAKLKEVIQNGRN